MIQAYQNRRLFLTSLLLVIAFCGLGYRLIDLQVYRHLALLAEAEKNSSRTELMLPRRGDVYDAKGNLLATSLPAKTVFADPVFLGKYQSNVAKAVAPLLGMTEWNLYHRLQPKIHTRTNMDGSIKVVTNRYVVLARKVPLDRWREIRSTMENLDFGDESGLTRKQRQFFRNLRRMAISADVVEDAIRVYPNRQLASHILGYVSTRDFEVNKRPAKEIVGMDGIERAFNSRLTGTPGWRETETDRRRREIATKRIKEVPATDGLSVHLTIDARLQHLVEQKLAEVMDKFSPLSATAILVRPQTGVILAMANLPTYDPNHPGEIPEGREDMRKNRAIMDVYEPGSTFKVVAMAAGLQEKVVGWNEKIWCEKGRWKWRKARTLKEYRNHGYEWMTVESILAKSSNIGTSKVAVRMPAVTYEGYLRGFGFGSKTDIDLVGEQRGLVRSSKSWGDDDRTRIPIGQGIAVTPLQITMAMAAIANGGYLMRPMLVDRLEDSDGNMIARYSPSTVRRVINGNTAMLITKALDTVVSKDGTGRNAIMDFYSVAGKTGTADKAVNGRYTNGKNLASFIGFLPASAPELVISVIVNEPKGGGSGGKCAAPCFREIAETAANYLNLKPDLLGVDSSITKRIQQPILRSTVNIAGR
jgi:cell division protein FtsI/penicillin-binding protein 2